MIVLYYYVGSLQFRLFGIEINIPTGSLLHRLIRRPIEVMLAEPTIKKEQEEDTQLVKIKA